MRAHFASFLCFFIILCSPAFGVAVDEKPLEDPVLEARARTLMKEVRCLVCQSQSIEDSNAELARDLRKVVREKVAEGLSDQSVKDYLVARYGDWVLLEPPVTPTTYFLWGSPLLFLLLAVLFLMTRKKETGPKPLSEQEKEELAALLSKDQES